MGNRMVAALFVEPKGCYAGLPGVDLWDEKRDARGYGGPHPVVAHPPCSRWCLLAGLVQARCGYQVGDDGGCFSSALASVRKWGGVLEHPAYTKAWAAHGLPPPAPGGWQRTICGGWVCHVEQFAYGHPARKATWLYAHRVAPPKMKWRLCSVGDPVATCKHSEDRHVGPNEDRPRLREREASATPPEFRDVLLQIARSAR